MERIPTASWFPLWPLPWHGRPGRRGGPSCIAPSWWGLVAALLGMALVLLGQWYDAALGSRRGTAWMCSIGLIWLVGGLVVCTGGWRTALRYWFPVAYLLCAVVWPWGAVNSVGLRLRRLAAVISGSVVDTLGVPVFREGNVLHLAAASLGVDDACSGLHSLGILLATAFAVAYWQRLGIRRGGVLVAAALLLAVLSNVLRVSTTAVLVHRVGAEYASGPRHEAVGYACFALGLAATLGLGCALRRPSAAKARGREGADGHGGGGAASEMRNAKIGPLLAAAVLLLSGAGASLAVSRHYSSGSTTITDMGRTPLSDFPSVVGRFRAVKMFEVDEDVLHLLRPSDIVHRAYRSGMERGIECAIMYWDPVVARSLTGTAAPHDPDVCFGSLGGERQDAHDRKIDLGDTVASMRVFRQAEGMRVVLTWQKLNWHRVPRPFPSRLAFLVRSWHEPIRLSARYSVILSTRAESGAAAGGELDAAKRRCVRFAEAIVPLLPAHGIAPDA